MKGEEAGLETLSLNLSRKTSRVSSYNSSLEKTKSKKYRITTMCISPLHDEHISVNRN